MRWSWKPTRATYHSPGAIRWMHASSARSSAGGWVRRMPTGRLVGSAHSRPTPVYQPFDAAHRLFPPRGGSNTRALGVPAGAHLCGAQCGLRRAPAAPRRSARLLLTAGPTAALYGPLAGPQAGGCAAARLRRPAAGSPAAAVDRWRRPGTRRAANPGPGSLPRRPILGRAPRRMNLKPLLDQADLFVLPGTGGLAVQQAMSSALPVIVAEGGRHPGRPGARRKTAGWLPRAIWRP